MHRILLVEDDAAIVRNLTRLLESEGYAVEAVSTARAALERLETARYDLVLLDVSLPDGNGFTVCTAAKREWDLPVVFLTASDDELSVVTGLDLGADDYISKPFRPLELLSRLKSVLRRSGKTQSAFQIGDLRVDTVKGAVSRAGREIFLSALEYRLLLVFLNHPGQVLSRNQLLENIWDVAGEFVGDNTLTVYIKRLREKIEPDPQNPSIIKTVRGFGYKLEA